MCRVVGKIKEKMANKIGIIKYQKDGRTRRVRLISIEKMEKPLLAINNRRDRRRKKRESAAMLKENKDFIQIN